MKNLVIAPALLLIATPAPADNGNWQVGNNQVHVVDDTIDLHSPVGRLHLLQRVERAAEKLCRDRTGIWRDECEVDTVRQAGETQSRWGRAIAIALGEREAMQMAGR